MIHAKVGDTVKFSKFASSGQGVIQRKHGDDIWIIDNRQCFMSDVTEIVELAHNNAQHLEKLAIENIILKNNQWEHLQIRGNVISLERPYPTIFWTQVDAWIMGYKAALNETR